MKKPIHYLYLWDNWPMGPAHCGAKKGKASLSILGVTCKKCIAKVKRELKNDLTKKTE